VKASMDIKREAADSKQLMVIKTSKKDKEDHESAIEKTRTKTP
jgi:hypothetical protein